MSGPLLPTPWMYGRRKLTRVEIAVYAVIVGTLIAVFTSYMLDYMEMAEKTAMQATVSNVTSALNLRYASHVMAGQPVDVAQWMSSNPFELAQAFPAAYRGELKREDVAQIERPAWLFDAARREILYLPRLHKHLRAASEGEVRFRLEPHHSGFGFALVPTSAFDWGLAAVEKNSQNACKTPCTPLFS